MIIATSVSFLRPHIVSDGNNFIIGCSIGIVLVIINVAKGNLFVLIQFDEISYVNIFFPCSPASILYSSFFSLFFHCCDSIRKCSFGTNILVRLYLNP
jgi:hypothetical protein